MFGYLEQASIRALFQLLHVALRIRPAGEQRLRGHPHHWLVADHGHHPVDPRVQIAPTSPRNVRAVVRAERDHPAAIEPVVDRGCGRPRTLGPTWQRLDDRRRARDLQMLPGGADSREPGAEAIARAPAGSRSRSSPPRWNRRCTPPSGRKFARRGGAGSDLRATSGRPGRRSRTTAGAQLPPVPTLIDAARELKWVGGVTPASPRAREHEHEGTPRPAPPNPVAESVAAATSAT